MLDGHIDEIGVIVQYIDDDGFVYPGPIGGWDPQVLVGQRIRFLGRGGDVLGVVGKKPIHLMKAADREHASKMTDLWVDIGASNRAEAEGRLSVGDPGVIDSKTIDFPNNRIVSRSIDDRIGAFVVLEALRRYAQNPGSARVVACATTQEEIAWHGGGALVCTNCINPQMAIVVDVTFATDHPNIEKKELGDHRIGGGPVLSRGGVISPVVFELLRDAAERIEDQVLAARGGARHVDERRRDPHRARGRRHRPRVDSQSLHALAQRAGEPRRRRQDRDAARRRLPRRHRQDGLHRALTHAPALGPHRLIPTYSFMMYRSLVRLSVVAASSACVACHARRLDGRGPAQRLARLAGDSPRHRVPRQPSARRPPHRNAGQRRGRARTSRSATRRSA